MLRMQTFNFFSPDMLVWETTRPSMFEFEKRTVSLNHNRSNSGRSSNHTDRDTKASILARARDLHDHWQWCHRLRQTGLTCRFWKLLAQSLEIVHDPRPLKIYYNNVTQWTHGPPQSTRSHHGVVRLRKRDVSSTTRMSDRLSMTTSGNTHYVPNNTCTRCQICPWISATNWCGRYAIRQRRNHRRGNQVSNILPNSSDGSQHEKIDTLQQQLYSDTMHQTEPHVTVQTMYDCNIKDPSWSKGPYTTCLPRPALKRSHNGAIQHEKSHAVRLGHRWSTLKKRMRALSVLCDLQTCERTSNSKWRLRIHKITNWACRTHCSHNNLVWPGWLAVSDNLNSPPLHAERFLIEPFRNTKP